VSYSAIATMAEAKFIEIPSTIETDFKITPQQLEAAITPKTKMIFFNSPNNPSGTVYTEQEYRALARVLEKYPNIYILSDEIYEHIHYGAPNFSFAAIESMYNRTITVNGVAKAFAMTGWRLGYLGAPEWIAKACTKLQGQVTSGTNSIAQRAAIAALDNPVSRIQFMVDEFHKRRDLVIDLLRKIDGIKVNVPKGAFYVFPDVSYYFNKTLKGKTIKNACDFSMFLLEEANVATVAGDSFGAPECIRISYAASQQNLIEAISRISKALK
jgi:aspartate aminotransferase